MVEENNVINICHLYPELLNSYGDIGNILILKSRLIKRGYNVNIINLSLGEEFKSDEYDIVFFGGGQDYEQSIVSKDLMDIKRDSLKEYVENNKVLLAICGGYQLLGKYYISSEGEKLNGLNILDIQTETGENRFIGNTIIYNEKWNEYYVGFENHSGRTYINNLEPLGKVILGFGNNGEDKFEGCVYKNTYCTYFHGPLLSKNPELADRIIQNCLLNRGIEEELKKIDDEFPLKAKECILNRQKSD